MAHILRLIMYFYRVGAMKKIFLFITLFATLALWSQEGEIIEGKVLNSANDEPLENVNIVNLNTVKGATTSAEGDFRIRASVNDTLYFSYLGFKSIRVRVTNDWLRFGDIKVKMTELGIALEEVVIKPIQLTGYVEVDAKLIPVYDDYRYRISGIGSGYEGGDKSPGAVSKVLSRFPL